MMAGQQGSRWRKAAVVGAITPALILGAAGLGVLPGGLSAVDAGAQSVLDGGACTAFGVPAAPQASELSVADVAEAANPAVVTIVNLQSLSQADLSGFVGIEGIPGMPELPNIGELPGIEGSEDLPGVEDLPDVDDIEGAQQIESSEDGDTLIPVGTGSGFIVDEAGHVVTNAHVVEGAQELSIALYDGTETTAVLIGRDLILDVAILQLDLPSGAGVPGIVSFGDSAALRAGEQVVAIGTALGAFPNSVSEGTVNAVDRSFPGEYGLSMMIQHDAEIWHGNSGGPLLNLRAEVIGVNTAGIGSGMMGADTGSADMAFAVEGNTVCAAAADLVEDGEIIWPYMGIQGEASSDGQTVLEVVEDGPSATAGLEVGDVITAFDGQEINQQNSLLDLLFGHAPGDVVAVTVERGGAVESFQVTLGERPEITE
jgi:S1-C subfamily serine protease